METGIGVALSQLINILTGGLLSFAEGMAAGVNAYTIGLLFDTTVSAETGAVTIVGLSAFGGAVAIFAAIALTIGITTAVFLWIKSLGN